MSEIGDAAGGQPVGEPEGQADPFEGLNEFGRSYIEKNVPEEHRPLVAQYLKPWDGEVTKAFQQRAEQIKAYEGIDPNRARAAEEFVNRFRLNPTQTLQDLYQGGHLKPEHLTPLQQMLQGQQEGPASNDVDPSLEKLLEAKLGPLQSVIGQIVQRNQQMEAEQQRQQQEVAYQQIVTDMKAKYGEFPEEWLLANLTAGVEPEAAMKKWVDIQKQIIKQSTAPRAPYSASATGQTPRPNTDVTKLNDDQTDDLVAQMLQGLMGQ